MITLTVDRFKDTFFDRDSVQRAVDRAQFASLKKGGAFLVGGPSLLTGLLLKRPGEDKRVFAEKKDSSNAGIEEGKRLVLEALRPESASPHPSTPSA